MLKHNDRCTSLDYMEKTLSYLTLQGWYDVDSAKNLNRPPATDTERSTLRTHLLTLQTIPDLPIISPVWQQVYHLRQTHVHGVCRSIKYTSLQDASEDFRIPNFQQLFLAQIKENWGHEVSELVLGYNYNVLINTIFIILQNGLLYNCQPFHNPTSVQCLGLGCKVEYTNANQGIRSKCHDI